jgi:carboxypeptidase PM20D1
LRGVLWLAGLALALLALVVGVRAARFPSRQPEVAPLAASPVDADGAARRLAESLRFATISARDPAALDSAAFLGLRRHLEASYPRVHRALARETVGEWSLLYTWRGRDPSLHALLLAAHQDVVPVDAGSAGDWTHPPFAGAVADGFVWGRGAMDDKASLVCILEAIEGLLAEGFAPERTLHLAFGHDEEVGGERGAAEIARLLAARGERLAFVLDEGGTVVEPGYLPGFDRQTAAIGVAEKGSVSIALEAKAAGGHSSAPPRQTAVGIVAAAVAELERHALPARIDGTTALFLDHLGPELSFPLRAVFANRWLLDPLLALALARTPATDAMLRTTTAATRIEGGVRENVLPIRARAVLNFRIHPRDSVAAVVEHVRRVVDDERIELTVGLGSPPREPSPLSPVDSEAYGELARTAREIFPGAVAVPFLVLGGTDARHYVELTQRIYRFGPFAYARDALVRAHGTDERIAVANLVSGVRFYRRLVERSAGSPPAP